MGLTVNFFVEATDHWTLLWTKSSGSVKMSQPLVHFWVTVAVDVAAGILVCAEAAPTARNNANAQKGVFFIAILLLKYIDLPIRLSAPWSLNHVRSVSQGLDRSIGGQHALLAACDASSHAEGSEMAIWSLAGSKSLVSRRVEITPRTPKATCLLHSTERTAGCLRNCWKPSASRFADPSKLA